MLGDPAGGDTFEDSINKCICKNAFVRRRERPASGDLLSGYEWLDGSSLSSGLQGTAPSVHTGWDWPAGAAPFYREPSLKDPYARTFTEHGSPGAIYRPLFDSLECSMRLPEGQTVDPRLVHSDGKHYLVLPAFFATLQALVEQKGEWAGREFGLVIRTFGSDGPDVAAAVTAWAEGKHPLFPGPPLGPTEASAELWVGAFDRKSGRFSLAPDPRSSGVEEASVLDEASAVALVEQSSVSRLAAAKPVFSFVVLRDDYLYWKEGGYSPSRGKPLWLSPWDTSAHPIFFDDNIHNDAEDSIVSVRACPGPGKPFEALSGAPGAHEVHRPMPVTHLDNFIADHRRRNQAASGHLPSSDPDVGTDFRPQLVP